MKTRTSIILGVVAIALAAFIYFFEQHQPTTDDLEERSDRILPGFDRDRVDRIVIGEGDDRVELSRISNADEDGDAGPPGSVGSWKLLHPKEVDADAEAVDSLLSSLDWLERRRSFEEAGAAKAAKFGLQDPRAQITIHLRGRDVALKIGGDAPGQGLYLALSDEDDKVYVVDREFLDQISKQPDDLRDRQLLRLRSSEVQAVRITGRFHVQREDDDRWELITPVKMRADDRRVDDVIRAMEQLRAKRFIADDVDSSQLEPYGLDQPSREAQVRLDGEDGAVTIRFGDTCEGHGEEVYAVVVGRGTVTCVERTALDGLDVQADEVRDMRATRLSLADLERIEIDRGGKQLVLRRDEDVWRIGEDGDDRPEADGEATASFVEALSSATATEIVTELGSLGLEGDEPSADATVRLMEADEGDEGGERLYFALRPEGVFLRRGDEGVALALSSELAEDFVADQLKFRKRQLLDEDSHEAVEIEVIAAGPPASRQVLRRGDNRWRLEAPLEFTADEVVVGDLLREFSSLRAERFIETSPSPEQGLSRPRIRLRVHFGEDEGGSEDGGTSSEGNDRVLVIGAVTEGGRFAQLEGDPMVFVISEVFAERLERPLIDRDLFAINEDQVRSLVLERGADRFELERGDGGWQSGGEAVAASSVAGVLSRLAIARASEVISYGAPPAEMGLAAPRARLFLRISEEEEEQNQERVIIVGAEYGDEETPRVYVRREDVDVTFGLPLRTVLPILDFSFGPESVADAGATDGD